jgi:hypothetical protein
MADSYESSEYSFGEGEEVSNPSQADTCDCEEESVHKNGALCGNELINEDYGREEGLVCSSCVS